MKQQSLSILFKEKPKTFGTRGDAYFWEYLQEYFACHVEFTTKNELEFCIKQQFKKITGEQLTVESLPYVEKFAHGGMSSGVICGEFWLDRAIPLLLERFSVLQQ